MKKLKGVFGELNGFEARIVDYGENASKFGHPEQINKAEKDIETIKVTVANMRALWEHIYSCQ